MKRFEFLFWAIAFTWSILAVWPASSWFEPQVLIVTDHASGEEFEVRFTGGARREFVGSYSVVMRLASDASIVAEGGGGPFTYRTEAQRPSPILISWWAGSGWEAFTDVPAGSYFLETCWEIHRPFGGISPAKTTCISSNIFKVE